MIRSKQKAKFWLQTWEETLKLKFSEFTYQPETDDDLLL